MIIALFFTTWVYYECGEYEVGIAHAERVAALSEAHGFTRWGDEVSVVLALMRSDARGDRLDFPAVQQRLMKSDDWRTRYRYILNCCALADAYGKAGQVETGLRVLDALGAGDRDAIYAPEIQRVRGELLLRQPKPGPEEAEQCFRRALDVSRRRQERALELRAATSLARLLAERGRRTAAKEQLAGVYGWFREGFDTRDLKAAEALLERL